MATKTWNATGSDVWSNANAWSPTGVPAAGDDVVFNGTSTFNCSVDVGTNYVRSLTISSAYTGTVTANADINIDWQGGATIDGALSLAAGKMLHMYISCGTTVMAGSGTISGAGVVRFAIVGSGNFNPSAFTYPNCDFDVEGTGPFSCSLTGPLAVSGALFIFSAGLANLTLSFNGQTVICGSLRVGDGVRDVIVNLNASQVNVGGNYLLTTPATVNAGNSTVKFTASASLTDSGSTLFYNVIAAAGTTLTMGSSFVCLHTMTIGDTGSAILNVNGKMLQFWGVGALDLLVLYPGSTITGTGTFVYDNGSGTTQRIPGYDYGSANVSIVGHRTSTVMQPLTSGNLVTSGVVRIFTTTQGIDNPTTRTFDLNGFNLTAGTLRVGSEAGASPSHPTILAAGDSVISATDVEIGTVASGSYATSGASGIWTVSGGWTNNSTSSSWSFAATLRLSGSSAQTIGGSGTKNLFAAIELTGAGQKNFTSDFTTASLTATVSVTMQITAGKRWTVTAGRVTAGDGKTLTLRSSATPTPWLMTCQATVIAIRVDVKDSDASGGIEVQTASATNSGGNTNWAFGNVLIAIADAVPMTDVPQPILSSLFNLSVSFPGFRVYQLPVDHDKVVAPCIFVGVNPRIAVQRDYEGRLVTYTFNVTLLFKDAWRDPQAPPGLWKEPLSHYYLQRLVDVLEAWTPDSTKILLLEKSVRRREPGLVRIGQQYLYGCGAEVEVMVRDVNPGA